MLETQREKTVLADINSYLESMQTKNPKDFDDQIGTIQQRAKDKYLLSSKKTTQELLDERNYWLEIKGSWNKSVKNRVTRLESVLVARYDMDRVEKERIAKQSEETSVDVDIAVDIALQNMAKQSEETSVDEIK